MYALLIVQQLLSRPHEGNSLRGEDDGLGQLAESYQLIRGSVFRGRELQLVHQAQVVVARDIVDHLRRLVRVRGLAIEYLRIVDLRVLDSAYDTELNRLLIAFRLSGGETGLCSLEHASFQGIPQVIAKYGHVIQFRGIYLDRPLVFRQRGIAGGPALAVDEDGRI